MTVRLPALVLFVPIVLLLSCKGRSGDRVWDPPASTSQCDIVSDWDEMPILIGYSQAAYPEQARRNGDEGVVVVRIGVGADSLPCSVEIVSSDAPSLEAASRESALTTKWIPARRRGRVVAIEAQMPIRWALDGLRPAE